MLPSQRCHFRSVRHVIETRGQYARLGGLLISNPRQDSALMRPEERVSWRLFRVDRHLR